MIGLMRVAEITVSEQGGTCQHRESDVKQDKPSLDLVL